MAAYEVLLLNTAIPQIQAAQSGDTYVVPRDIAFSAALTLSAGTANGIPYLNGSKVLTSSSALQFDGTNLGLGVTPSTKLEIAGNNTGVTANNTLRFTDLDTSTEANQQIGKIEFYSSDSSGSGANVKAYIGAFAEDTTPDAYLAFATGDSGAATERARITSGGDLLVGTNSQPLGGITTRLAVSQSVADYSAVIVNTQSTAANCYGAIIQYTAAAPNGTSNVFLLMKDNAADRAYFRSNGGLSNYQSNNTDLSDARTKTDINPLGSYWNKIAGLEIVTYKYKDQTHDDLNIGVIAQQVEAVAPEFVDSDGFGDTPEDGVPLKTIYNKDLTFAAIKALQEAMARIETLEAKIAALEAK